MSGWSLLQGLEVLADPIRAQHALETWQKPEQNRPVRAVPRIRYGKTRGDGQDLKQGLLGSDNAASEIEIRETKEKLPR